MLSKTDVRVKIFIVGVVVLATEDIVKFNLDLIQALTTVERQVVVGDTTAPNKPATVVAASRRRISSRVSKEQVQESIAAR